jgi:hypothetical protein
MKDPQTAAGARPLMSETALGVSLKPGAFGKIRENLLANRATVYMCIVSLAALVPMGTGFGRVPFLPVQQTGTQLIDTSPIATQPVILTMSTARSDLG